MSGKTELKKGYTKKVLQAQIRKYKETLKMNDNELDRWLDEFGDIAFCPVCSYRHKFVGPFENSCRIDGFEHCLAIADGRRCDCQYWFNVVVDSGILSFPKIRRNLAKRLKFWQKIYAEKYPEVNRG